MKKLLSPLIAVLLILTMQTSQAGINTIKSNESFRSKAYPDGKPNGGIQRYSTGFGHSIQANELHLKTAVITVAQAEKLMHADIAPLEIQVNRAFPAGLKQNQFDVFIDFGYNEGSGALAKVMKTWSDTHSIDSLAAHLRQYNKKHNAAGQLVVDANLTVRREQNIRNFKTPSLPPAVPVLAVAGIGLAIFAFS